MKIFLKVLFEIADEMGDTLLGEGNPLTWRGMRKFVASLDVERTQFYDAVRNLQRKKYIEIDERGDYKITPKGAQRLKLEEIENSDWQTGKWSGRWIIVVFDVPEKYRKRRDAFRSFLIRKGFYGLQDSVFVSPFANFDQLNFVRHEYGVAKFVNIFESKSASIDDDHKLRKHFNI